MLDSASAPTQAALQSDDFVDLGGKERILTLIGLVKCGIDHDVLDCLYDDIMSMKLWNHSNE